MMFVWIIGLALIVFAVWFFMKGQKNGGGSVFDPNVKAPDRESAKDILEKRFAKGELTREEYEERKEALEK